MTAAAELLRRALPHTRVAGAALSVRRGGDSRVMAVELNGDAQLDSSISSVRNVYCAAKPAWLVLLDELTRGREIEAAGQRLPVHAPGGIWGCLLGPWRFESPSTLQVLLTHPSKRRPEYSRLGPRDTEGPSDYSLLAFLRGYLRERGIAVEERLQATLTELIGHDLLLAPMAAPGRPLDASRIQPATAVVDGRLVAFYNDRRAHFLGDPDFAVVCGLASADSLSRLGLVLLESPTLLTIMERRDPRRAFACGLSIDGSRSGHDSIGSRGWLTSIGLNCSGVMGIHLGRRLSFGYTSSSPLSEFNEIVDAVASIVSVVEQLDFL